jgi:hypothetical protein
MTEGANGPQARKVKSCQECISASVRTGPACEGGRISTCQWPNQRFDGHDRALVALEMKAEVVPMVWGRARAN